jgi:hypothetical protein
MAALNPPWLIEKCKNLRLHVKNTGQNGSRMIGNFFKTQEV